MRNFAKIVFYIVAALQTVLTVLALFESLGSFAQFISVLVTGVPPILVYIVLARLLSENEALEANVRFLENELIRKDIKENPIQTVSVPEMQKGRRAIVDWTCPKCGTVNKANTTNCEHCGAAY